MNQNPIADELRQEREMCILEGAARDPGPLLRDALADVPGLRAAFIFGSTATGEQRGDSDIDVLIVEEPTSDRKKLLRHLGAVALLLGREVNAVRYTPQALADRLGDRSHPARGFVHRVLRGPKQWIAGASSAIAPLAAAAGLSTDDLAGAAVLLDVDEYERLVERAELAEDIRTAEAQLARSEGVAHDEAREQVLSRLRR